MVIPILLLATYSNAVNDVSDSILFLSPFENTIYDTSIPAFLEILQSIGQTPHMTTANLQTVGDITFL